MSNLSTLVKVGLGLLILCVSLAACNPREWPGLKQAGKRAEDRGTRATEEAIKKSPSLQELHRLCTEEIPRPNDFVPVSKDKDPHGERYLGYGYHSSADYKIVKEFYVDQLTKLGWQLVKQKDGGWGPREVEFRKDDHLVKIYDMGQGEGINYSLHCEKLAPSLLESP
ncbi:MAG TPA: hypothetical protein VJU84_03395 [Pyrinomonadaceae bacterium]|nr:hypothetical protein [Pyrinomonadaceae bacterium]